MSNYVVSDSSLTSVADAIRTKGGTSAPLAFPSGFVAAIGSIPTGGGGELLTAIIGRTVSEISNSDITTIGNYAFCGCSSLTSVDFPACTHIGSSAFARCSSLTDVNFPACRVINGSAFQSCSSIVHVDFPACETINPSAFDNCSSLTDVNFPACKTLESNAFGRCYVLLSVYLGASSVCTLARSTAFLSTPIAGDTSKTGGVYGSIFVPASLYSAYISATNWTYFKSRIASMPEV